MEVIIIMFWKLPALRKNKNLHLVIYLSASDFLAALFEIPYIIYMTLKWNNYQLDFDPLVILISSTPLPLQRKVSAIITIGIAIRRNLVIFFSAKFRKLEQSFYSEITLVIGIVFGVFDVVLMFVTSPITRVLNCGTSGCFIGKQFRSYWGTSNMILGFIVVILSISIFFKIKSVGKETPVIHTPLKQCSKFQQANRTTTRILISSLFFLTIPSLCVGILESMGYSIFRLVGPFYSASLMLSGISNGVIFIGCNGDARRMIASKSGHSMSHTNSACHRPVVLKI